MASKEQTVGIAIAILTLVVVCWQGYDPPIVKFNEQEGNLTDGQQSYIQLKNSGGTVVEITVNFGSDGGIRFKDRNGKTVDSWNVTHMVCPTDVEDFCFTPVFNNSLKNVTLIVKYRPDSESLPYSKVKFKSYRTEGCLLNDYEQKGKSMYPGGGMEWNLQRTSVYDV